MSSGNGVKVITYDAMAKIETSIIGAQGTTPPQLSSVNHILLPCTSKQTLNQAALANLIIASILRPPTPPHPLNRTCLMHSH